MTQVNEPPVITTKSRTEFSLRENSTSTIYTYRATDQDDSDTIRWSVEGADGGDFAIHNGLLTFRLLPDLENPVDSDEDNVYEITVVASDQAGLRDTVDAVITITDQSEGPVIAGTNLIHRGGELRHNSCARHVHSHRRQGRSHSASAVVALRQGRRRLRDRQVQRRTYLQEHAGLRPARRLGP